MIAFRRYFLGKLFVRTKVEVREGNFRFRKLGKPRLRSGGPGFELVLDFRFGVDFGTKGGL